ncbi:MAG: SH3 domain-containing protein [Lachnospiraceae bacterium]|nr:SH3 domain-containing protein [Lachnospiraceae bacterium]
MSKKNRNKRNNNTDKRNEDQNISVQNDAVADQPSDEDNAVSEVPAEDAASENAAEEFKAENTADSESSADIQPEEEEWEEDSIETLSDDDFDGLDESPRKKHVKWTSLGDSSFNASSRKKSSGKSTGNRIPFIVGGALLAVLVIVGVGVLITKNMNKTPEVSLSQGSISGSEATVEESYAVTTEPLAENAYSDVNTLVAKYFAARSGEELQSSNVIKQPLNSRDAAKIEARNIYVEKYENINCYTKPGPYEGSYVVFATYDLKLKDWEQTAPGLITIFVCTDTDGSLYVHTGDFEEKLADYIREVSAQEDVTVLLNAVDENYNKILDSDADFAAYMNSLNELIKNSVGEILAEAASEEGAGDSVSDNSVEVISDGEIMVETTDTVNVRSADDENAERLGVVNEGTQLICLEQRANGWSKVEFNGEDGYIKTEFLKELGGDDSGNSNAAKATIKETVNVRSSASTSGEKLGLAYAGESYEIVESAKNGWIGIKFNGKTGYVKTDYVDQ